MHPIWEANVGVRGLHDVLGIDQAVPAWQDEALCAQTDPEMFFPDKGGSARDAKKVCRRCEVRAECLEHALTLDERFGIWGGLTERERRHVKQRQRAGAPMLPHDGDAPRRGGAGLEAGC